MKIYKGENVLIELRDLITNGRFSLEDWYGITGKSAVVLHERYIQRKVIL